MSAVRIAGDGVLLRPTTADDLPVVAALFRDPGFFEHWGGRPLTDDEIRADLLGARSPSVECFLVVADGQVAGYAQYYEPADDGGGGAGMDLVLLPAFRGRGIGTAVVRAVARFVTGELGWRRFVVDPEVANERGVRFWTNVGFRPVRVVEDPGRPPYWLMEWPIA